MLLILGSSYAVIMSVGIIVSYVAYRYFDDDNSREFIINWSLAAFICTTIIYIPLLTGTGAFLCYHAGYSGFHILLLVASLASSIIGLFLGVWFLSEAGDGDLGGPVYRALKRSKRNKAARKLLSDEEIAQEARIRLKMERYKNTITATNKELEIQQYVNEKRGYHECN